MKRSLEDVQIQLIESSLKTTLKMLQEFEDQNDAIVNATAHKMAERMRELPLRVRQELLMIYEQYQDDPNQILAEQKRLLDRIEEAADSPFAKFSRLLKGGGYQMGREDWKYVIYTLIVFFLIIPIGVFTMSQVIQIFQDSPQQVQGR